MDPIFGIKLSYVIISWNFLSKKKKKKKSGENIIQKKKKEKRCGQRSHLFLFFFFWMESTHLLMGHDYLNVREKTYIKQSARRFITDEYEFFIFYKCMYINI